jgi:uncharacterized protein (TIGR02118 family)
MIRVTVLYPSGEGSTFDHDYYRDTHVPMALAAFGLESAQIDRGVDGPYVAGVHFLFDGMEQMQAAMASPDVPAVMADIANFTNVAPVMQVSETA